MSNDGKYARDKRPPRVDWVRLNQGPSASDLREMPAMAEADWQDAELLIPIDEATYREFQAFLAKRRKKAAQEGGARRRRKKAAQEGGEGVSARWR